MVDPGVGVQEHALPVSVIAPLKVDRAAGAVLDVDRPARVAADGRRGGERHRDVALRISTSAALVLVKLALLTLIAPVAVAVTFVRLSALVPPVTFT